MIQAFLVAYDFADDVISMQNPKVLEITRLVEG